MADREVTENPKARAEKPGRAVKMQKADKGDGGGRKKYGPAEAVKADGCNPSCRCVHTMKHIRASTEPFNWQN